MYENERWSRLAADIGAIIEAHGSDARSPSQEHRKWDGRTPYAIHPLWCATTIATETTLEQQTRLDGFTVLLYHDVLEDTNDDTLHCNGGEVLVHPKDAGRKPCDNSF